jgi:hypothetical protein
MYGTIATEKWNFRLTNDYFVIGMLVYALLYFVLANGPEAFAKTKWCRKSRK